MNVEQEIEALAAESRALQMIIIGLFRALVERDKRVSSVKLGLLVTQAFAYADYAGELSVAKFPPSKGLLETLSIIEQLRSGVFGGDGAPKKDG